MNANRDADIELLMQMSKEELIDLFFLQMRNLWAVDGLYFLGIEEKFGTESATQIDTGVWEVMGKIEARRIKDKLGLEAGGLQTFIKALRLTSWSLDLEEKEIVVENHRALFRNTNCRVQNTRVKKGLEEFPCKMVRLGYLRNFAKEFNERIEVNCNVCPPDEHPDNLWCEWEFKIKP
jgi:hypothetical protein